MVISKKKSYFSAGIIIAICLLFCLIPAAQAADITELAWEKTDIGNVTSVEVNEAGSLVYAAASNNGTNNIICYNAAGQLQWSQPLTGSITTIKTTQSGGYVLAITGANDNKSYLYNSAGSLQWSKTHTETPVDCDIDKSGSKLAIITANNFYGYDIAGNAIGTYPAGVGTWKQVEIDPDFVILSKNVNTTIRKYQFNSSEAWPNELHTDFGFEGWGNRIPITTTNTGNFNINITNVTGHADGDVFLPASYMNDFEDIRFANTSSMQNLKYSDNSPCDPSMWTQATGSAAWAGRYGFTSLVYDNKMWVIGGRNGQSFFNDVWYSSDGATWIQTTGSAAFGVRHYHTSLVYDNKMWVMGGHNGPSLLNDVWYSSDGSTWIQATSSAAWSVRAGHQSVVYDDKIWVIGAGYSTTSEMRDVWYSSDGATWTQATGSAAWAGRYGFTAEVFDDKMWVIGGSTIGDVWYSSDGATWTQATGSAAFGARHYHSSISTENKLYILGGNNGAVLNDVWYSSDGSTWTQATSSAAWSARADHQSVYYNGKIWILGGSNDVWATAGSVFTDIHNFAINPATNSSTIYLYYNNPDAESAATTGIEANESFTGTIGDTETSSTATITEFQAAKSHTGNVTAMSLPEAGDYIGVQTDSYIYHQQITDSGFGSTYSANCVGTPYDIATSDSAAYSVEGRSTNADIYSQIAAKTGTYSTGGNVLHTTIAQANSLWSAAGSADGKVYIFSKEDSSSWYLDNSSASGDTILDMMMTWRGEFVAVGRNSGLQYFQTASSVTPTPTPTAEPTAATGSEVWFTVYVFKDGQPYLYQPVTVSQYNSTSSTYIQTYTGQTDSEGKYVCQLTAGERYLFNVNDEKSEIFEIQSTNLYQVINILTSSVTATTEFSARYNATTNKIEFEYYDYKDGGGHTGQLRLKIYRTDTWEQVGNYLYDYENPFAWDPDFNIGDFSRFTMVQGVVNEIPVPDPNTNYKIEMTADRSDGGTVKNHFFVATGSQIINLPIDSTISNVLFSCFLILLGGLFGYASSARGALVVAFSATFFVYIGWLSIPWYWIVIAIIIAILAGFAKRRI